jgi:hypothetical protein
VTIDNTRGHRDDEKHNISEQGDHGNLKQNTSNRRSLSGLPRLRRPRMDGGKTVP